MRNSIEKLTYQMITAMVAVVLSLSLLEARNSPEDKHWTVKYHAGHVRLARGSKLAATIEKDRLVCRTKEEFAFSVPVAAITEVAYERATIRSSGLLDTEGMGEMWANCYGEGCAFVPVVAAVGAVLNGILRLPRTSRHLVNFLWQEDGRERALVLELGKGEYRQFLDELQKVRGKKWKDTSTDRDGVRRELEPLMSQAMAVSLDRKAAVAGTELSPGEYHLVFLERASDRGELYWFAREEKKPEKLVAMVFVSVAPLGDNASTPQVDYVLEGGTSAVSALRLRARTFRLRPQGTCFVTVRWLEGGVGFEAVSEANHCGSSLAQLQRIIPAPERAPGKLWWRASPAIAGQSEPVSSVEGQNKPVSPLMVPQRPGDCGRPWHLLPASAAPLPFGGDAAQNRTQQPGCAQPVPRHLAPDPPKPPV